MDQHWDSLPCPEHLPRWVQLVRSAEEPDSDGFSVCCLLKPAVLRSMCVSLQVGPTSYVGMIEGGCGRITSATCRKVAPRLGNPSSPQRFVSSLLSVTTNMVILGCLRFHLHLASHLWQKCLEVWHQHSLELKDALIICLWSESMTTFHTNWLQSEPLGRRCFWGVCVSEVRASG